MDSSDDLLEHIAETFSEVELEDPEATVEEQVSASEAMKAVGLLLRYHQQREDVDLASISHLNRIQRHVTNQRILQKSSGGQTTLDMYF